MYDILLYFDINKFYGDSNIILLLELLHILYISNRQSYLLKYHEEIIMSFNNTKSLQNSLKALEIAADRLSFACRVDNLLAKILLSTIFHD